MYDWVTWKVIINRTTWLNTNDDITWHQCLRKEPILLQSFSSANRTPLYSITANSAISAENVEDCAISTSSALWREQGNPHLASPLHPSRAGMPDSGFPAGEGSTHILMLLLLDRGFTGSSVKFSSASLLFPERSGGAVQGRRPGWAYFVSQLEKESNVLLMLPALSNKTRSRRQSH